MNDGYMSHTDPSIVIYNNYRQLSNIRRTSVGHKIVDHSDVVGAAPVGRMRRKTSKFGDLVRLILEIL